MSSLDFDINAYRNEELYQLVNLSSDATKEQIYGSTNDLIQKYLKLNQPTYYHFFIAVQNRLLKLLENATDSDDGDGNFIKTEYQPNNAIDKDLVDRSNSAKIVDDNNEHMVLRRERLPISQGTGMPFVQGQMNPTLRNVKKQLINIDSQHRELLQCASTSSNDCSGVICSSNTNISFAQSSTDFTFNLSQPVKHVLKMSVYSYEIPHSWYVFSPDYGTSSFGISGECIDISAGNYTPSNLIQEISGALTSASVGINVTFNSINNKVTFSATDATTHFDLIFYDTSGQILDCSRAPCPTQGAKLDYNLGWLLGFRQPSYSSAPSYTGEALIDTYGFRYLFIELDDFNNNRLNQGIISLDAHRDTFSYSASKRCTMSSRDDSSNPFLEPSSSCGKPPPPTFGPPLTRVETYSRTQLLNAQQQGYPDRYLSPVNSDIIARIPVRKFQHYEILFDNWSSNLEDTGREYFGPVTLKRMHVRLLNDKGYIINLNNMNFSFSLIVEHLYQY